MKKVISSMALMLLVASGQVAMAQRADRDSRAAQRVERQAESLAKSMDLDGEQKTTFVSLYKEYQDTLRAVRRDAFQPKRDKDEKLSEEEAEQRILASFEREAKVNALKQEYYKKFRAHFKASQLVRVFVHEIPAPQRRMPSGGPGFGGPMQGGPGARGGFGGGW